MPLRNLVFDSLPGQPTDQQLLRLRCDSQSLNYYADISAFLSKHLPGFHQYSLLDVGPRTGTGLALLRLLHHPAAFTRLKFDPVAGIDLDPGFEATAQVEFPDIGAMTGDIADLPPKSWDIVTCSHTIEHVPEPDTFVDLLKRLARRYVLLACPYAERNLSAGHINSIDYKNLTDWGFQAVEIYESQHFHNGVCCLALMEIPQ